jgi:hypothetical protein
MNRPLSVARALIRSGIESPIAKIALALAAILPSLPALAQHHEEGHRGGEIAAFHEHEHEHDRGHEDHGWHGDIAHFHEHDWDRWRGGRWAHEEHDGRLGWWWIAGDAWYWYAAPVYPYPDPYAPPEVVADAPAAAPPDAPVPKTWYYCEAEKGYYPYVSTCPSGWKAVPANPSAPPPQ